MRSKGSLGTVEMGQQYNSVSTLTISVVNSSKVNLILLANLRDRYLKLFTAALPYNVYEDENL